MGLLDSLKNLLGFGKRSEELKPESKGLSSEDTTKIMNVLAETFSPAGGGTLITPEGEKIDVPDARKTDNSKKPFELMGEALGLLSEASGVVINKGEIVYSGQIRAEGRLADGDDLSAQVDDLRAVVKEIADRTGTRLWVWSANEDYKNQSNQIVVTHHTGGVEAFEKFVTELRNHVNNEVTLENAAKLESNLKTADDKNHASDVGKAGERESEAYPSVGSGGAG